MNQVLAEPTRTPVPSKPIASPTEALKRGALPAPPASALKPMGMPVSVFEAAEQLEAAGVKMSMSEFFAWWRAVAEGNAQTVDLCHVRMKIANLRRHTLWQLEDNVKETLRVNFNYYGINQSAQSLRVPLPLHARTFESSNFIKVYAALQQRATQLGHVPTLYVLNAVRELVKSFLSQKEMESKWSRKFKQVLEQVLRVKHSEQMDTEAIAEYLWTSAMPLGCGMRPRPNPDSSIPSQ